MFQVIAFAPPYRSKCLAMAALPAISPGPATGSSSIGEHPFDLSLANRAELVAASTAIRSALHRLRHHRRRRRSDRSHRIFRRTPVAQQLFAQLRTLPWSVLRPLALRHRHQRQNGLPLRRREACSGRCLDSGGNSRHLLRRQNYRGSERPHSPRNHRPRVDYRRVKTALPDTPIPSSAALRSNEELRRPHRRCRYRRLRLRARVRPGGFACRHDRGQYARRRRNRRRHGTRRRHGRFARST